LVAWIFVTVDQVNKLYNIILVAAILLFFVTIDYNLKFYYTLIGVIIWIMYVIFEIFRFYYKENDNKVVAFYFSFGSIILILSPLALAPY